MTVCQLAHQNNGISKLTIALQDTCAHSGTGGLRLCSLLGELKSASSTMTDSEASDVEWSVLAAQELSLESRVGHVLHQVVWTWAEGDIVLRLWCVVLNWLLVRSTIAIPSLAPSSPWSSRNGLNGRSHERKLCNGESHPEYDPSKVVVGGREELGLSL